MELAKKKKVYTRTAGATRHYLHQCSSNIAHKTGTGPPSDQVIVRIVIGHLYFKQNYGILFRKKH